MRDQQKGSCKYLIIILLMIAYKIQACEANCTECNGSNVCTKCSFGYDLATNCSTCLSGNNGSDCSTCNEGYYNNGTDCINCISGNYIENKTCIPCSSINPNCDTCDSNKTCQTCLGNFTGTNCSVPPNVTSCNSTSYLENNTCIPCSSINPNCDTCDSNKTCQTCLGNFTGTNCSVPPNVTSCNSTSYLENNTCIPCSSINPNCDTCDSNKTCQTCLGNFTGTNCSVPPNVTSCNSTSYLENNTCIPCSSINPNCDTCDSNKTCQTCLGNFTGTNCSVPPNVTSCNSTSYLENNTCIPCSSINPNCDTCDSNKTCQTCLGNFTGTNCSVPPNVTSCNSTSYLENNTCIPCSSINPNCDTCDSNKTCQTCLGNFTGTNCSVPPNVTSCNSTSYLENNTCIPCSSINPNCDTCDSNKTCQTCLGNFTGTNCSVPPNVTSCNSTSYLENNTCIPCSSINPNCDTCDSNKTCQTCLGNFTGTNCSVPPNVTSCNSTSYLENNTCIPCSSINPNCDTCDSNKTCQTCLGNFTGTNCSVPPNVTSCNSTSYLENNTCIPCSSINPNCDTCDSNKTCQTCLGNFTGTNCSVPPNVTSCNSTSYLENNTCIPCSSINPNCDTCDSNKTCQTCLGNFTGTNCSVPPNVTSCNSTSYLENNTCIPCSSINPNCDTCDSNKTCQTCLGNFTGTNCSVPPNVTSCNSTSYLENNTCIPCSSINPNCDTCDSNKTCQTCLGNFTGTNCSVPPNVTSCNSTSYLENNTCIPCSSINPNCDTCDSNKTCQTCLGNFTGTNCSVPPNVTSCNSTSYLENNTCIPCSSINPNCDTCDSNKTCQTCLGNFTGTNCSVPPNVTCSNGTYRLPNNSCSSCSSINLNCLTCDSSTNCLSCSGNFTGPLCTIKPAISSTNSSELILNSGLNISSGITLSTPPIVNQTTLTTLPLSSSSFITSNRIQSFTVTTSSGFSTFQIFSFNHSYSNNLNTLSISNITGSWSYLKSSSDNLSCIIVSSSPSSYLALQFDSSANTFQVYSNFTENTSILSGDFMVGQKCSLILKGNSIYTLNSSSLTLLTTLNSIKAYSSSLEYIINNNTLLGYSSNTFVNLNASLTAFSSYRLKSYGNQIIAYGYDTSSTTNTAYNITQTLYIGVNVQSKFSLIQSLQMNAFNNPTNQITVRISPQMTKIHYQYYSNSTLVIVFKDVDYTNLAVKDVTFKSQTQYLATRNQVNSFTQSNYHLGDSYLVIRNDSGLANSTNNTNITYAEEVYSFIASNLIYMRTRTLASSEVSKCYKISIDTYFLDNLYVLNLYNSSSASGYDVFSFAYGNLASTIKVIPSKTPSYLTFTPPSFTSTLAQSSLYQWFYIDASNNSSTNSTIAVYRQDDSLSSHLASGVYSFAIAGSCQILATSKNCLIFSQNNFTYTLVRLNQSSSISMTTVSITSLISGTISKWMISDDCSRFSAGNNIFAFINASYSLVNNNFSVFSWTVTDSTFTYVFVSGAIWKYNSTANAFNSYYSSSNLTFTSSSTIKSYSNRLIIYELTSSAANAMVFLDNTTSSNLSLISTISLSSFSAAPKVALSPQLSKLIVYGTRSNGTLYTSFYYLDYSKLSSQALTFPAQSVFDPQNIFVALQEDWLYVRQLKSTLQTIKGGNQQTVYYIHFNSILTFVSTQNITQAIENSWARTLIAKTSHQNLGVYTQITQATPASGNTPIVVQSYEVASPWKTGRSSSLGSYTLNGLTTLCTIGCSFCTATACSSCSDGYIFDANSNTCFKCAQNCLSCSSSNINACYSCKPGSYLSGSSCLQCNKKCLTCSGSATTCLSCLPGFIYNSSISDCSSCSRNCLACGSNGICTSCRVGFVAANSSCRSCIASCSSCQPLDVTTCTACYKGLQLINGACVSCPDKCNVCYNQSCVTCIEGYHPNSNGTCVQDCLLPCATCSDNLPSSCLSCFAGTVLNGTTCVLDLSCNSNNSCTSCGQGTNYILVVANCLACPSISNCVQCRLTNSQACSACLTGYYVDQSQGCSSCPTGCTACSSSIACSACSFGYTLPEGYTQAQCIKCSTPCVTCRGSSNYCTSCEIGYTKHGWKCQNNKNIGFKIRIAANVSQILQIIDQIVEELLRKLGMNTTLVDAITFTSIKPGSVDMEGFATPSNQSSVSSGASQLSSSLSSSSLGGYSVVSSSVVSNGLSDASSTQQISWGYIIELSFCIVLTIILFVMYIVKLKNQRASIKYQQTLSNGVNQMSYIQANH